MLKLFIKFNKSILGMAKPWQLWMVFLVSANMVLPWFFLGRPEALTTLVAAMIGIATMTALYSKYGFVRLLGLGHFPWLFTVPWLWSRLSQTTETGIFYYWLIAVVALNSVSLIIDTVDVIRYWMGDRQPVVSTV
jgi:hypothetical protein